MGVLTLRPFNIKKIGTIQYFNAGDAISAVCSVNEEVTLTAKVVGSLVGHEVLWEQVGGNTGGMEFTTPTNEITVKFINHIPPGTTDDKVFRFWIDKGSVTQQHADVVVYGTPTTQLHSYGSTGSKNIIFGSYGGSGGRSPMLREMWGIQQNPSVNGIAVDNPTIYGNALTWNIPNGDIPVSYSIYRKPNISSSWEYITTTTSNWYYNPTINYHYIVYANYLYNNDIILIPSNVVAISSNSDSVPGATKFLYGNSIIKSHGAGASNSIQSIGNYSINITILNTLPVVDNIDMAAPSINNNLNLITGYNVNITTLQNYSTTDNSYYHIGSINKNDSLITGYNVLNIGGVTIGG